MTIRIAILASGRGSNLQAILDAIAANVLDARVIGVFSDKPDCAALQRVDETLRWAASPKSFADKSSFERVMGDAIEAAGADWIVCAGYMRILGEAIVQRFAGRMLNIHPSLLPRHKGLHTHQCALDAGDAEHGASVHFVTEELDAGAVIAQARVPVLQNDDADTLAARVLTREHPLLIAVLQLAASQRIALRHDVAMFDGQPLLQPLQLDCDNRLTTLHP